MSPTTTKNGVDPGLNINLDWQSLSFASELSDPLQSSPLPPGSSSPPPPEQASLQWMKQLGTTDDDFVSDIATDSSGNIYMVGSTTGELFIDWGMDRSDRDGWLAKFNSNGTLLWGKQILSPVDDIASRVAVDNSGNVYVAGSTHGVLAAGVTANDFGPDTWLAKYDSNSNLLWSQQKAFSSWDSVSDLEVDRLGNVYMSGQSYSSRSTGSRDISWVEGYNSNNGEKTWGQSYSIGFYGETKNITGRGLAIDNTNNLYVALNIGPWMRYGQPTGGDPHAHWDNGVWHSGIEEDGRGSLVSKYDTLGNLLWQKYLSVEDASGDRITAGNFGNFYLSENDAISQYNSNGELLWRRNFTQTQTVTNITTDAQGNAYLSGWSGSNDAWSAKYNDNGTLAWEEEFGTSQSDRAYGIAVDATGKVYLAGSTQGALGQANTGGEDIWLAQYLQVPGDPNNTPESLRFSLDRVQYKATDTLNLKNGWVQDLDGAGDITHIDLQFIDPSGMTRDVGRITDFTPASWSPNWTAFNYNLDLSDLFEGTYRLSAIAYDMSGASSSAFERRFSIYSNTAPERLQFNLENTQYEANETLNLKNAWVYDKDGGNDVALVDFELIDGAGNAIDLGDATQFTSASWSHQWANFDYSLNLAQLGLDMGLYTLRGTAYDRAGGQGSSFERKFQLNLPTNAALAWVQDSANRGNDIAIDNEGNLYITGTAFNSIIEDPNTFTGDDIWVAKYDRNGNLLWQEEWGTTKTDSAEGITVDNAGNVYLTGSTEGDLNGTNAGRKDAWLAKYDRDGNRIWVEQLGTTSQDRAVDVVVDEIGNLYMMGDTEGNLGSTQVGSKDSWVAKYNSDGGLLWVEQWGRSGSNSPTEMTVDNLGNLYISGNRRGDAWLTKYNGSGDLLWTRDLGATASGSAGVAADRNGNIYLTGYTYSSLAGANQGQSDVWLAKYDSNGDRDWLQQFGTNAFDNSDDITVDDAGNIYLTGGTQGSLSGTNVGVSDIWVRKYDSTGNLTWEEQWGTNDAERVEAIAVDGGNLYLVGQTGLNGVDPDNSWIVKYA